MLAARRGPRAAHARPWRGQARRVAALHSRGRKVRRMHHTSELHVDNLHAVLCRPAGGASAGLLLLPMVYGIEAKVLEYAGWLADAGFAAVVWDPYSGRDVPTGTPEDMAPLSRSLRD